MSNLFLVYKLLYGMHWLTASIVFCNKRSSRGGFDLDKIIAFLKKHDICQLYVIGGDGTHRGAFRIHEGCMERVSSLCLSFSHVSSPLAMLLSMQKQETY